MKLRKSLALALLGLVTGAGLAFAGGIYTNGLPSLVWPPTGNETIPADTNLSAGVNPQTEAITTQQMATFSGNPVTLTDGATINLDASKGRQYTVTLGGNRTLANPTNLTPGQQFYVLVNQDSTGSRTLAYGSEYWWVNGAGYGSTNGSAPTLATSAGAVNILHFIYNGTSLLGVKIG